MHCAACGNAACYDGQCSVLRWASQRAAFSGQELCTSPKSAQGESVHPPKHVPECFSSPTENSAARQQRLLPLPRASTFLISSQSVDSYCTLCFSSLGSS